MNKYFLAASGEDANVHQAQESKCKQERRDACLDEALGFTFPASDPIALNYSITALPGSRSRSTSE